MNASKRFVKTQLVNERRFITATMLATCGTTLAIILQAFAFARAIQLVVIEREGLSSIVPWLLVFAAGSILRCVCTYLTQRLPAEGALRIQQRLRRSILDAAFVSQANGMLTFSLAP